MEKMEALRKRRSSSLKCSKGELEQNVRLMSGEEELYIYSLLISICWVPADPILYHTRKEVDKKIRHIVIRISMPLDSMVECF